MTSQPRMRSCSYVLPRRIVVSKSSRRPNMSAKRLLIVMLATLLGAGMLALFGHSAVVKSRALNTVQAATRANNYFRFEDGHEMHVAYRGEQSLISALNSGAALARSIASIDFDRDGTPDVVA